VVSGEGERAFITGSQCSSRMEGKAEMRPRSLWEDTKTALKGTWHIPRYHYPCLCRARWAAADPNGLECRAKDGQAPSHWAFSR
jgi:hypothetical protein